MGVRLVLAGRHGAKESTGSAPPGPGPWLGQIEQWVRNEAAPLLEDVRFDVDQQGHPVLFVRLHPAAEDVSFVAADGGRVVVAANTYSVGPGYHRYLCELLRRLGHAFGIEWSARDLQNRVGDPTGYFDSNDASALEGHMLRWLADVATHALTVHRAGHSGVAVSLRFGHTFDTEAPLVTPMGPRDAQWLQTVKDDPRRGTDIFPWWDEGTGGTTQLGRALTRLWTEMVWRPPLLEEERRLFRDVAVRLASAFRDDPSLSFPWGEWRDLLGYLGMGGTLPEEVSRRAAAHPQERPPIGYRRAPVRVSLPDGWSVRIPGSLAESMLPGRTWVARDHRRTVRFTVLEPAGGGVVLPEGDASLSVLEHRGERVRSRALVRVRQDEARLVALCQAGERRALCAITSEDGEDREWLLETWRSIDMLPRA